mgnify:CR=1 FL=1
MSVGNKQTCNRHRWYYYFGTPQEQIICVLSMSVGNKQTCNTMKANILIWDQSKQ